MRTAFMFRGQLHYANRDPRESPIRAVARSLKRRLGADVQLWWAGDRSTDEVYRAQWFDSAREVFEEAIVKLERA